MAVRAERVAVAEAVASQPLAEHDCNLRVRAFKRYASSFEPATAAGRTQR